jgi:alkylation response protein AidB-like acyl-CoA dehydrogenase
MTITNQAPKATDPAVYDSYSAQWAKLPSSAEEWIARAREVADVLRQDATARDAANASPLAEVALLKHSGLLKVLGREKYGGGGQPWSVGYAVTREVAKGDGSIGMLLGYHTLWSQIADVVGSEAQADALHKLYVENNWYIGGAVNPRDNDLKIADLGDEIAFSGFKHFTTGAAISDLIVLEGAVESGEHIFAVVETKQPGIEFAYNWNNVGLRLTESGSATISDVRAPWSSALGWKDKSPDPAVLGIAYPSLLLPLIQLVFSNFYLGIAQGALATAKSYTSTTTRPWPFGGDNKDRATDEFYILERYGNFYAHLAAAEALTDKAGAAASALTSKPRAEVTPRARGEFAELVASVKVVNTDTALRVTAGLFEVTGARATASKVGFDRFWRDVRTHTLHDPVAYKNRELGRYVLLDEVPEPTWYT